MRWQQEIHDILEKSNWPPDTSSLVASPWPRVIAFALVGWGIAELIARLGARGPRRAMGGR
jgi:hypothetical protein